MRLSRSEKEGALEFVCKVAEPGTESKEDREGYWATAREHPIRRHRTRTGALGAGAFKIYDFLTPRQLRRTQFYGGYFRYSDCPSGFLMSVSLPAPEGTTRTLLVDRQSVDFGERERNLLSLCSRTSSTCAVLPRSGDAPAPPSERDRTAS
jgi:hypothetical protein